MSKVRVKGHDLGVDVRSIKQLDIRRKGKKVIVEVLMQAEKSPRQYLMATYEDAIEFYKIVWELRQRSLVSVRGLCESDESVEPDGLLKRRTRL